MQYRKMPKIKDELSVLGYGCMRFPTKVGGSIDKDKALKQIRYAIDSGVNYLDTAWPYHLGASESFLGDYVLKDGYRDKVKIATKLPCFLIKKAEDMDKFLNKQLEKLKVENIDYYLLHALDKGSWEKMLNFGVIEFMNRIKKEGKIVNMGFSYHGKREDFKEIIDAYDWDFVQIQYNLLDENFQAGSEGIDYAASKNIGVIVMEPLRGGTLVGQIPKEVDKLWNEATVKRSPADWALRWIWNNPNVHVILSGLNNEEHIIENVGIAEDSLPNSLTEKELEIIDEVKQTYHRLLSVGCTGCRYCMPCPVGIDIPFAFQTLNNHKMFNKKMINRLMYMASVARDKNAKWTLKCIDCGKCEKNCPQNIEIRKEFRQVQKNIETPALRAIMKMFGSRL